MDSAPVTVPPGEAVAPLNFIYACSVCCYSFADVYEGRNETVRGFSDGINPKERLVTHLYLASCCHVFCGSHIEGGGPSFHPGGQRPKAPCPVCIREKGDKDSRDLYSIRGFHKNEYDPMIPPTWFTTPPISFEGKDKGTEALRVRRPSQHCALLQADLSQFQYLALTRYCQNTHAARKPLQDALTEANQKLVSIQDLASEEHARVLTLQQENERLKVDAERLRSTEEELQQYRGINLKDLDTFRVNKDAIRHYLKLVPMLIKQNEKMKSRLASLGFAMALEPIPNFPGPLPNELDHNMAKDDDRNGDTGACIRKTASSHTAGGSAHTSGNPTTTHSSSFRQRPNKRQRVDSPLPGTAQINLPTSRNTMPPPQKPVPRLRSVRGLFPTLRKKLSNGRSTPAPDVSYSNDDDVAMYEYEQWDSLADDPASQVQLPVRHNNCSDAPYMSGALPVEQIPQKSNSKGSQLLSSIGIDSERPEFTFRASSPVKLSQRSSNQPVQIPTEPSYIRLLDGLSHDNRMELGLKDPRDDRSNAQQPSQRSRQVASSDTNRRRLDKSGGQQAWTLGPSYHHRTPNGPYRSAGAHLDSPHLARTDKHYDKALKLQAMTPITPAPRIHHEASHQIESVVSPFLGNNDYAFSRIPNNRSAEPQDSSNRSTVYRSPKFRMEEPEPRWREPRGLNGLSFFESPVISRNQPNENSQRHRFNRPNPSRTYQSRNVNSDGFTVEPEAGQSPFFRDSTYGPSRERPTCSQQQHVQPKVATPFSSFNRSVYSRVGQAPSAMPSVVSDRSSIRPQLQWQGLQRMGVRSSRHNFSNIAGNTYARPTGIFFPGAARRSVRR